MAALLNSTSFQTQPPSHFHTLSSTFKSCSSLKQAKEIHAYILRNNLPEDIYSKLFVYCTSPSAPANALDYAAKVFEQLQHEPNVFMWNTMIRGYAISNSPMKAISMYTSMRERGVKPNNYTFNFLVRACIDEESNWLNSPGRAVHAQSIVFGIPETDVHVYTSLLNMYGSEGNVEIARGLFDRMKMKNRTVATWNAMIAGYARKGDIVAARELFNQIPEKDEQSWNVMVCGYTRIGKFDDAEKFFSQMPVKTVPTWNAMIAGYTQASRPAEALQLFHQMQLAGVRPDEITVSTILPACAQLGALELGEWVHNYVERNKFDRSTTVCNAIIDMYSKCGCIGKAMGVFKKMRNWSVVSWNTMISGLAIHGRGEEAIELFAEMENKGVTPDDITFVGILNACAHSGLVERARYYFGKMQEVYGIIPKIEHYGCMVDVLGRAHYLDEALKLVELMPMEPNSIILGSLLSACRTCNDSQRGKKVLEKLVELEPSNSGYYVLLSNMYASAGQWKEVIRVRKLMKSRGIKKTPGCSVIEIDNTVHEFVVGDKSHYQIKEVYRKLDEISMKLESAGYVPDTSVVLFDLDEEEKEQILSVHSEKLAVAFGLLNAKQSTPIRVVKNLRVCRDCHSAIKLISQVYDHEITVRDCSRFHHFKNGSCSCNDFW